jgi:predicted dehydrogenase
MTGTKPAAVVVGTSFGCRIHVPALRAAGFEVAGLVGTNPERTFRRAQAAGVERTFTNLDEAIAKTGAKAVTIATPPHSHGPLTLAALARGCHLICEKPFARDTAEARTMQAAAERAGVMALVGNEFRWLPDRALVARAIADGLIGEPRFLTLTSYNPLVAAPDAKMPRWWFDETAGGGWLGAQGAHIIDQVRTWLGDFASLSGVTPTVSDRAAEAAEDSYVVRFTLKNGVEGVLQHTAGAWGPSAAMTRVAGTRGTLWVEGADVWLADRDGKRQLPVTPDLELPPAPPPSDDPRKQFSHFELGPYVRLAEALRAGVDGRDPKSAVPLPTFEDGVAAMQVIDAVRASAAQGGTLVEL